MVLGYSQADMCSYVTNLRLEEAELNLHETGQECAQVKELRCQLQADVINLQDELQRKEASLQTALSEKAVIERNLGVARSELERAKQQVNEMSAQLDENAEQLQIIQEQVDGKHQEIESLTQEVCISLALNISFIIFIANGSNAYSLSSCVMLHLYFSHTFGRYSSMHACVYLNT